MRSVGRTGATGAVPRGIRDDYAAIVTWSGRRRAARGERCSATAAAASRAKARQVVASVIAIACLASCSDSEPAALAVQDDAIAYVTVIEPFLPSSSPEADPRPVVFVSSIGDDSMSLDSQIEVIESFGESYDVQFIDVVDAVLQTDVPGAPPKDDGVLLAIGLMVGESPYTVRVEVYRNADDVDAHLVIVVGGPDDWSVDEITDVEPEVFAHVDGV